MQLILDAPEFWARLVEISFLNMLLSGDNAVVIALAVRADSGDAQTSPGLPLLNRENL